MTLTGDRRDFPTVRLGEAQCDWNMSSQSKISTFICSRCAFQLVIVLICSGMTVDT